MRYPVASTIFTFLCCCEHGLVSGYSLQPKSIPTKTTNRRNALSLLVGTASALVVGSSEASAFENKISNKYDDRPKRRGPMPKDLGVGTRVTIESDEYFGLKLCGPAPNCFSSSIPMEEDPDHSIPAWAWPDKLDKAEAFEELYEVLKAYPPGQNGVDGGGFKFQKCDTDKGYIYVVYEALKNGYHDDAEFAYIPEASTKAIQVRSSSRVGYLDYGVNAKRLNWIGKALRAKGWNADGVNFETHKGYALENQI
mmetsp:Transcript_3960/g.5219  ORF Transcript_3960/g.5219 Transcript_3960/m.5219 type:complete len:253 (+) Transcript_3960:105-863(+)|eukprot:CAMPEP_0198147324 /NCGR_PEP_ID=MMETSP1443-20131203/34696_1 /TAXON_ID=186043 /ORGANISM="Entomoneis sp., Strain CCMP2396" /LENGTH=252 /DNA_ID=CAMNT_0043811595 /DNA_START=54 /DNA_END=812 /DNA_ORIENTATION=-